MVLLWFAVESRLSATRLDIIVLRPAGTMMSPPGLSRHVVVVVVVYHEPIGASIQRLLLLFTMNPLEQV